MMSIGDKINSLIDVAYKISLALVAITEIECCSYGFNDELKAAEDIIMAYEDEHNEKGYKDE